MIQDLRGEFLKRSQDIRAFLRLLPVVGDNKWSVVRLGDNGCSTLHHPAPEIPHILKATAYLLLYNSIESTISDCVEFASNEVKLAKLKYTEVSDAIRRDAIRYFSSPPDRMDSREKTKRAQKLADLLTGLCNIEVPNYIVNNGNLSEVEIYTECERFGVQVQLSKKTSHFSTYINRPFSDNWWEKGKKTQTILHHIREARNNLAHGNTAFNEAARQVTVNELKGMGLVTISFLADVIDGFANYSKQQLYRRSQNP